MSDSARTLTEMIAFIMFSPVLLGMCLVLGLTYVVWIIGEMLKEFIYKPLIDKIFKNGNRKKMGN